ncbi:MAG: ribbon-helix-helix protein, CopG family [Candidatus Thiodiazotropha lotti]|nr:ribbon-helix-helix protein, CopG family [Candidatus Thiodiazotropha lotti]MCG7985414.1 ribbon-helix-helix protein, CopG family [Candidatus Thiodiazotropha lotti]MCW4221716.1 ribbon-helix-helix protein, CopG family [Candidatus Thiodiazotropha lotti]
MSVTSIRLQADLEDPLKAAAERHRRSKNWIVNQAVREYLQRDAQELQRWRETEEALESARQGRVVAGETVHEWLDSWGSETEKAPPKP